VAVPVVEVLMLLGVRVATSPGEADAVSETLPEKVPTAVTVIVEVPDPPATKKTDVGLALIEKSLFVEVKFSLAV